MNEVVAEQPAAQTAGQQQDGGQRPVRRRRAIWWRLVAVSALLMIVVGGLYLGGFYALTKKPLTSVPGVSALTRKTPPSYSFSIYGATQPHGVALSQDYQRLYVADALGERNVRVYDRNGVPQGDLVPPLTDNLSRLPLGLATDFAGQVYVTDRVRRAISIFSSDGRYAGDMPAPEGTKMFSPLGIATDRNGQLLVTESSEYAQRVWVFDQQRQLKMVFGQAGDKAGELSGATSAVSDDAGRIYVADSLNGRVEVFRPDGTVLPDFMRSASGSPNVGVALPWGVAVDDQSRLYVVDNINSVVVVYDVSGNRAETLFTFGNVGSGDGQFQYPTGIATDGTGRVYVADRDNSRVQVWTYQ